MSNDTLNAPHPDHIEHITFEGNDRVILSPEDYEELYAAAIRALKGQPPAQSEQSRDAMIFRVARVLCDRSSEACNVDKDDNWNIYSEEFTDDARAVIAAMSQKPEGA